MPLKPIPPSHSPYNTNTERITEMPLYIDNNKVCRTGVVATVKGSKLTLLIDRTEDYGNPYADADILIKRVNDYPHLLAENEELKKILKDLMVYTHDQIKGTELEKRIYQTLGSERMGE